MYVHKHMYKSQSHVMRARKQIILVKMCQTVVLNLERQYI